MLCRKSGTTGVTISKYPPGDIRGIFDGYDVHERSGLKKDVTIKKGEHT
jgi:hypothetical protein